MIAFFFIDIFINIMKCLECLEYLEYLNLLTIINNAVRVRIKNKKHLEIRSIKMNYLST